MHADPITHADQHEQAAHDNTQDYYAALRIAEVEIRQGFTDHFCGKPGATLPSVAYKDGRDQVIYIGAQIAVNEAADYEETSAAFRGLMTGALRLDQFQAAIVAHYIEINADDIVWCRTGLTLPSKNNAPIFGLDMSFLTVMTKEAT